MVQNALKCLLRQNWTPLYWLSKCHIFKDRIKMHFKALLRRNKPYDKVLGAAQLTKRIKACKST